MFKLQEKWFKMADNERATRRTDPMNIRIQAARLETRRNFFSHRVPEVWKGVVPRDIRQARTAQAFKMAYKDHRWQMVAISWCERCQGVRATRMTRPTINDSPWEAPAGPWGLILKVRVSKYKKPSALNREHPHSEKWNLLTFFYVFGSFLPSWIRIRIANPDPGTPIGSGSNLDPDPQHWVRIRTRIKTLRIRNTVYIRFADPHGFAIRC